MNNSDKVAKDAKILIDSVKDVVSTNLVTAARTGTVDLTEAQLSKILSVVGISVDEGYQRAVPTFQNMVKKYVSSKPVK